VKEVANKRPEDEGDMFGGLSPAYTVLYPTRRISPQFILRVFCEIARSVRLSPELQVLFLSDSNILEKEALKFSARNLSFSCFRYAELLLFLFIHFMSVLLSSPSWPCCT
jgi:hypothetical protein